MQLASSKLRHIRRIAVAALAAAVLMAASFFILDHMYPPNLGRYDTRSQEVLAADGSLLRLFAVENGRLRQSVSLDDVDPLFVDMLLAYEDKRFFDHSGVDVLALSRAMLQAATNGRVISGASTLTMQTARLLEPRQRTLSAKVIEMFRAVQLEQHFSKQQILEIYLTLAPYGGNIEGIQAGSRIIFGHDAVELRPDEAALLVALPQSPSRLRPDRHNAAAMAARNKVLERTASLVSLDRHMLKLARAAPVPSKRFKASMMAHHLSERVRAAAKGGYRIQTTIDQYLQRELEGKALQHARHVNAKASVAILVVENKTRRVRAYVGSADTLDADRQGYVDMIQAVRSPGSTLKPFIFGLAFERGLIHPATIIRDEPRSFGGYEPANFMDKHHGDVTMREALQRSLNVPAVAVLDRIGPVNFTARMRDAGAELIIPGDGNAGLAVALGGVGVSLEQLTGMYAALADDGDVTPLRYTTSESTEPRRIKANQITNAKARVQLMRILQGVRPPGNLLPEKYQSNPRRIAYKTGTSYGFRDAWALGYDTDFTVGVWVGRPDGTPLPGHFGANTAAPLLFNVFQVLPKGKALPPETLFTDNRGTSDLPLALRYFDRSARLLMAGGQSERLTIKFPADGSVVETGGTAQNLTITANGGLRPLQWFIDGKPLKKNRWSRTVSFRPESAGFFRVSVVDQAGIRAETEFRISDHNK